MYVNLIIIGIILNFIYIYIFLEQFSIKLVQILFLTLEKERFICKQMI